MSLAEAKNLEIGVNSESDVAIVASQLDLATVVTNLMTNAIHYTPAGGRIRLSVIETAGRAVLVVEDEGPGIRAADRARVFEPLHRRPGTGVPGSGLGLSIVQTIVDRLGGHITLTDAADSASGLRAVVTIPTTRRMSIIARVSLPAEMPHD